MYMHAKKSFAFENTRYQLLQLHYLVKTAWGGGGGLQGQVGQFGQIYKMYHQAVNQSSDFGDYRASITAAEPDTVST